MGIGWAGVLDWWGTQVLIIAGGAVHKGLKCVQEEEKAPRAGQSHLRYAGDGDMTNVQLYLAVGLPTLAVLVGILMNAVMLNWLSTSLNARMASLDNRMASLENRIDMLTGKVVELDNRLTRLEERLERR